jgi:hypothetical protein
MHWRPRHTKGPHLLPGHPHRRGGPKPLQRRSRDRVVATTREGERNNQKNNQGRAGATSQPPYSSLPTSSPKAP